MIYNTLFYDIKNFILKYPNKKWNINYLIKNNKITNFKTLTKFKYIDEYIINEYPNKPWDWGWLIENTDIDVEKHISLNLIKKYLYKWDYYFLSKNLNITEEFILKYSYKKWNINYLIKNNKITNFKALSKFKYIDEDVIYEYPNKPWDWEWLIENTDIKVERYIPLNLIKKYLYKWDYWDLSFNPNIIEDIILKHPNKSWNIEYLIKNNKITDFNILSKFKYIDEYDIKKYPDKPWDWEWLIKNTNINVEYYIPFNLTEKYKNKQNYYQELSKNSSFTEKFILKYPYQQWDIDYLIKNNKITDFNTLSKFKNINQNIIKKYPNKPWDWEWLLENTNIYVEEYISLNLIKKYPYKWNYYRLSYNPNLTEEFILKYLNKYWNIEYLLKNNKITNFNALSKFKSLHSYTIYNYPNKPWDWEWLIENTNINIEYYIPFNLTEKYSYKWNYWGLSYNPDLTEEFILKYPYQDWNINYLIKNNKITDFNALSKFKNIYSYIIDKYPNKPWDWEWLIENNIINVKKYIPLNSIKKYLYKLF